MTKAEAIALLGGTAAAAARAIGISPSAVSLWPDELPARISDRVLAALARKHLPKKLLADLSKPVAPAPETAGTEAAHG